MAARIATVATVVADFATLAPEDMGRVRAALAIVTAPREESAASAHWNARDITCPRSCGRSDFRTINGAAAAHRRPNGGTCK